MPTSKLEEETVLAMIFDSVRPAEVGEGATRNSDDAYVELSHFFSQAGIAVPKLLFDGRNEGILLVEDLGDILLGEVLLGNGGPGYETVSSEELYRLAIAQSIHLQQIPKQVGFFPFERRFNVDLYEREMSEFSEFFLPPFAPSTREISCCQEFFAYLANEVANLEYALCHRDYHSWNLMVDAEGALRIIDFQDALMAPKLYDLVALLNDRDTDQALGEELYHRLLEHYRVSASYGPEFYFDYYRVLLQRDLKVVGRFAKLVSVRKLPLYGRWIPGTFARVRRGLTELGALNPNIPPVALEFQRILERIQPNVERGAQSQ